MTRLLEPLPRFVEPAGECTESREREAGVHMWMAKVRRERLLTRVLLEYLGVIAALEDPERFDQAVGERSIIGISGWDAFDRWEHRVREIGRELRLERAI